MSDYTLSIVEIRVGMIIAELQEEGRVCDRGEIWQAGAKDHLKEKAELSEILQELKDKKEIRYDGSQWVLAK